MRLILRSLAIMAYALRKPVGDCPEHAECKNGHHDSTESDDVIAAANQQANCGRNPHTSGRGQTLDMAPDREDHAPCKKADPWTTVDAILEGSTIVALDVGRSWTASS